MVRFSLPIRKPWKDELSDLIRGASGGFLFGIPLLYTMEVWWIGSFTEAPLMLLVLAIGFAILFCLNRTDGFRQISPDDPLQAFMDSVEGLAIGIVCVTIVLVLLREITLQTPLDEALGKIVLEGMPFTIGVGLARSIMVGRRNQADSDGDANNEDQANNSQANNSSSLPENYNPTLADLGATLIGTIFIAFNVAPTDEVTMLAAAVTPPWQLAIVLFSIALSYCIVFAAGFTTQERRLQQQGAFQDPLVETIITYLLSLVAAAMMLWFFHQLSFSDPWTSWLERTIILGLPASIGGAAGRLAV